MLGYLLARAGIDVLVLETWRDFLRDFRGDTIHPSTMDVLHELGLLEAFLKLPHNETRQMVGHIGGEPITLADFTHLHARCPFIAFIPQSDFLDFLAAEGRKHPAFHLRMETEVLDLVTDDGRIAGVRARTSEGDLEVRAQLVVGADGRHSTVRGRAGLPVDVLGAPIDVLWFRLSAHEQDPKQSFGYMDDGKVLVQLDRGDYWQCGFLVEKGGVERIKARGIEAFRDDIVKLAPFLKPSVGELTSWEQVKLLSVAIDRLRTWYRDGLLMIGDAAHAMSPLGGVGINLAIQDAVAAANILIPAFERGAPTTADLAKVQKRRELPTRMTQRVQVLLQDHLLMPALKSRGHFRPPRSLRLLSSLPLVRRAPARFVGIGFRPEHITVGI
jgi:2-polyprenyl-6-methoxyphenol hydroxylase-like FAD-dependent oxidoreductase